MARVSAGRDFAELLGAAAEELDLGAPSRALELSRSAVDRWPAEFLPHYLCGRSLEALGQSELAQRAYAEALDVDAIHPQALQAHLGLSRTLSVLGDEAGSAWHCQAAASLDPNAPVKAGTSGPLFAEQPSISREYLIRLRSRDASESRAVPPAVLMDPDESAETYLEQGQMEIETMLEALRTCGFDWEQEARALELGCGSGRSVRWLMPTSDRHEVWGVDVEGERIRWAMENLSPPWQFATITNAPELPFPVGYFDLIFAGPGLADTEELHVAWLLELSRVLSPEGRLHLTLPDETAARTSVVSRRDERARAGGRFVAGAAYIEAVTQPFLKLVGIFPRAHGSLPSSYVLASRRSADT